MLSKMQVSQRIQIRRRLNLRLLAISLLLLSMGLFFAPRELHAQVKKPITKDGLVKAIQLNGLSTRELVQQIQMRGVDFQLTPQSESELRGAGARPEVIEAARMNYRSTSTARTTPGRNTLNVPAGPPLSEGEIILLLQSGKPAPEVEQWVQKRGVNFRITPTSTSRIMAAHGTRSLLGVIAVNGPGTARRTPATSSPAGNRRPDYDDLTDQAINAFKTNNTDSAVAVLLKAISIDPSRPTAYQLLGFVQLYGRGDITNAEKNMRQAIQRGGSAVFQVKHDHSGNFKYYCEGSFFITKSDVAFKANDGVDTFEALDTNIKEIKTNSFIGGSRFGVLLGGKGDMGAFHITPKVKINGKGNFNFSPRTEQKEEAKLIIALINDYQATNAKGN